jgi:hypothetical protein
MLSDDVSDDDSFDDGTECYGDNVERWEGDWESVKVMIIAVVKWTLLTAVFIEKDKTQWGKVKRSAHIRRRW